MKKVKYYHCSKKRFKKGQRLSFLSSIIKGRNYQMSGDCIYMTTSPYPHFTIWEKAVKEGWFVYEVHPIGKIIRGWWDDLTAPEVEIVKMIGKVTSENGLGRKKSLVSRFNHRPKEYYYTKFR